MLVCTARTRFTDLEFFEQRLLLRDRECRDWARENRPVAPASSMLRTTAAPAPGRPGRQFQQPRGAVAQVLEFRLPLVVCGGEIDSSKSTSARRKGSVATILRMRKTPEALHHHDDLIVGLAQEFEHERRSADVIKILRRRFLLLFVALIQQADDFCPRQRVIERA